MIIGLASAADPVYRYRRRKSTYDDAFSHFKSISGATELTLTFGLRTTYRFAVRFTRRFLARARFRLRVAVPGRSRHSSRGRSAIVPATAETHVLARRTVCTVPYAGTIH